MFLFQVSKVEILRQLPIFQLCRITQRYANLVPKFNVLSKVVLTVTNDLVVDQRVHRIAMSLRDMGFEVLLIGRLLKSSMSVERPYQVKRFRLLFNKSWLFYANYNARLFLYLLFLKKYDVVVANDLDTLPAAQLATEIRCKKLVFDAHEYFTEVPELVDKPVIKKIWGLIEKMMVPKASKAYTVCTSLAEIYQQKYRIPFEVIRNLPLKTSNISKQPLKNKFPNKKIILYQGSVNKGRGLELMINAMHHLNSVVLVIIGDGDIKNELEERVTNQNLVDRVHFTGRIPFHQLPMYTQSADLGISLEEDLGLNYRYALPNKLFDYIQAHVPLLVSDLPEMKAVVETYKIGKIVDKRNPEGLASIITPMLNDEEQRKLWTNNLQMAAKELCWEREQEKLKTIYADFL